MNSTSQTRQRVRKDYAQRRGSTHAIDAFTFPKSASYFADTADGTLFSSIVRGKQPLDAQIPTEFAGANLNAKVQVEYAYVFEGTPGEYLPLGGEITLPQDVKFPYDIQINIQDIPENGTFALRYNTSTPLGDEESTAYPVIKDTIPPWQDAPGVPTAPVQEPAGTITQDVLDKNPTGITYKLTKYNDYAAGDKIALYLEDHVPEEADLPGLTPVFVDDFPQTDPKIVLTAAHFNKLGSGDRFICYVLQDKAGNIHISLPLTVHIALGTLPVTLDAPKVALAEDGLLSLADAGVNPVDASVQLYVSPVPQVDTITLHWGAASIPAYTVNPDTDFPMPITIPKNILKDQYDKGIGGVKVVSTYYTLGRSSGWSKDSDKADINVDFSYVGPELPDWPNPVNDNLPDRSIEGKNSGKANELDSNDRGEPAIFKVKVYDNVNADEVMDIYWANTKAYTHIMTTEQAGDDLQLEIPWSFIDDAGNSPSIAVDCRIHNGKTPHNEQKSKAISVIVNAIEIPPPAKPTYPTEETFGTITLINCQSLRIFQDKATGIPVTIPSLKNPVYKLKDGDTINIEWKPLDNSDVEIPDAKFTASTTLNDSMIQNGFHWEIKPYADIVQPVFDFGEQVVKVETTYSFIVDGVTITSDIAPNLLGMMHNDYRICDIPTIPFP